MIGESQRSADADEAAPTSAETPQASANVAIEIGGREGLEPTRYGDWEKGGRCIDF